MKLLALGSKLSKISKTMSSPSLPDYEEEQGLSPELQNLLGFSLHCSEAFKERLDQLAILQIDTILWLFLGALWDQELDMFDLLQILHGPKDDFDVTENTHEFKEDIIKLYSFLFLFKHNIIPRLSDGEEFDYTKHFCQSEFITTLKTGHAVCNRAFCKAPQALAVVLHEEAAAESPNLQQQGNSGGDPTFNFLPTPEPAYVANNTSMSSKKSKAKTGKPSAHVKSAAAGGNGGGDSSSSSSSSSSDDECSADYRLRNSLTAYTKEPKFQTRSPVDAKHVFNGDYNAWDETATFLRAFAVGRNMSHLVTESFLTYCQSKKKKGYDLAKIYRKTKDDDRLTIRDHQLSLAQFKSDISTIYSAILSVFRKGSDKAIITKHKKHNDGISAWINLHAKYDNKGASAIAADQSENIICEKHHKNFPGDFSGMK